MIIIIYKNNNNNDNNNNDNNNNIYIIYIYIYINQFNPIKRNIFHIRVHTIKQPSQWDPRTPERQVNIWDMKMLQLAYRFAAEKHVQVHP